MKKIILFIILTTPNILMANSCDQANSLVKRSYFLQPAQEKTLLKHALNLCPNHAIAHNNYANLLENESKYKLALSHYRQALKFKPQLFQAWIGIADVYYVQKQYALSLEAYLQVCTKHSHARKRVTELLKDNRYRNVEQGEIITTENLALLYNKPRLQKMAKLTKQCQKKFKSISTTGATKAMLSTIITFRNLQFQTGKFDLSLISDKQLNYIATTLIVEDIKKIKISGHSDNQVFKGKTKEQSKHLNWQLSLNRAKSIKQALSSRGVENSRITTAGYGNTHPIALGEFEAAYAKNRRVEIKIGD
jgi:outer membrane protein OmpA-like peptidoglycan-associated protein